MSSPSNDPRDSGEIDLPEVSGKIVLLTILGLAILATGYAWWHQQQRGQGALEFWGREAAFAVRHAKAIELIRVDKENGNETIPISDARGLIHARQALIVDASYDWEADVSGVTPHWEYALRFPGEEGRSACSLWFDLKQELAGGESGEPLVKIHIAKGLKTFFGEKVEQSRDGQVAEEEEEDAP